MSTAFLQQRMSARRRKARFRRNIFKAVQTLVFVVALVAFAPWLWRLFYKS